MEAGDSVLTPQGNGTIVKVLGPAVEPGLEDDTWVRVMVDDDATYDFLASELTIDEDMLLPPDQEKDGEKDILVDGLEESTDDYASSYSLGRKMNQTLARHDSENNIKQTLQQFQMKPVPEHELENMNLAGRFDAVYGNSDSHEEDTRPASLDNIFIGINGKSAVVLRYVNDKIEKLKSFSDGILAIAWLRNVLHEGKQMDVSIWLPEAIETMKKHIAEGVNPTEVINDLASDYTRKHGNDYSAFETAWDLLDRHAFKLGIRYKKVIEDINHDNIVVHTDMNQDFKDDVSIPFERIKKAKEAYATANGDERQSWHNLISNDLEWSQWFQTNPKDAYNSFINAIKK